ncbi:Arginyl-tRNA--protein transferase 1 [Nymphon striatum]|nr:Arginyl-tRNA--protein transferase 1 [Nymphon striatum]
MHSSFVDYLSSNDGYRCGYCKCVDSNYSHGMICYALTVNDYSALVNRGWRRSGKYCYKPTLHKACCPQYTISCDTTNFVLSRSQKKVLKCMNRFLQTGIKPKKDLIKMETEYSEDDFPEKSVEYKKLKESPSLEKDILKIRHSSSSDIKNDEDMKIEDPPQSTSSAELSCSTGETSNIKREKQKPKVGDGADPNKAPCVKSKLHKVVCLIFSKLLCHLLMSSIKMKKKTLEQFLNEYDSKTAVHKLKIKVVRSSPRSNDFSATYNESFLIYSKYQINIHKDEPAECDEESFDNFLVESPLQEEYRGDIPEGYGSFHQQYWLDDKLIAVGVIDILPTLVSSVYLYYDPEYSFLSLGTYSALVELNFTRELCQKNSELKYYYMGLYVHSCPKLRYKGNYYPSFLLCPETYKWFPIKGAVSKINKNKYSRLNDNGNEVDTEKCSNISDVRVLHNRVLYKYATFKRRTGKTANEVLMKEYVAFVGTICAERMIYMLSETL